MPASKTLAREVPLIITFLLGVLTVADYGVQEPTLQGLSSTAQSWVVVIAGFAVGIGVINLLRGQWYRVKTRQKGWYNNALLITTLALTSVWGIIATTKDPTYSYVYFNLTVPLTVTVFGMLAFYIASAAVRSLRLRNIDAGIMLVAAALVMLRNIPAGAAIWSSLPAIGGWVLDYPNLAAQRGIVIGIAIGVVAVGVRTILGYERGYLALSGEEKK